MRVFLALLLLTPAAFGLLVPPKVQVTLYFETLCPGCQDFIVNHLQPALPAIGAIADIHLLPYGNAHTSASGVKCQHGAGECVGNIWENCAINQRPAFPEHFPFVLCMEQHAGRMLNFTDQCASVARLDYGRLRTCAEGQEGEGLLVEAGKRTGAHSYVPWLLIDGRHADENRFLQLVCAAYTGPKPPACAQPVAGAQSGSVQRCAL